MQMQDIITKVVQYPVNVAMARKRLAGGKTLERKLQPLLNATKFKLQALR